MAQLPVTKLVTQYCKDLRVVASLLLVLSKKNVKAECCCISKNILDHNKSYVCYSREIYRTL